MQLWDDFVQALTSASGRQLLVTAVVPFVAILLAGIIAAVIGRSSAKRLIEWHDREAQASAVATLIGSARRASVWGSLTATEKDHVDAQTGEAEIRVRMLPLAGSTLAADWAAHELAEMKRNSLSYSFQADQTLAEFRDRLLEWQSRPGRAKKLFRADLERFKYEQPTASDALLERQHRWLDGQEAAAKTPSQTSAHAGTAATPLGAGTQSAPASASAAAGAGAASTASTAVAAEAPAYDRA